MRKSILVLSIVAALLLVAGGGFYLYMRTSLPTIDGEVTLAGLDAPVTIIRDANAVPHIAAETEGDLFFGLGYAHAQDRLWQMEMNRRIAQGRLAEILGPAALEGDKYLRTLSLNDRAKKALALLDERTRGMLEAYARGVNAYLKTRSGALPPEFIIAGADAPAPWTPLDTMGWYKVMALDLGGNWQWEVGRLKLLTRLTPAQIEDFYPPLRGDAGLHLPDPAVLYDGAVVAAHDSEKVAKAAALTPAEGLIGAEANVGLGSNNWVIAGARSASGKPLLANDPHLGFTAPSIWYLAHLSLRGKNLIGVTFPGAPSVVLGRNDRIAWGFTNTGPDVQDLYMERIVEGQPGSYRTPEGTAEFSVRREVIAVKDEDPVEIEVRESRHGPILSDVLPDVQEILPEGHVLALRWTALDDEDATAASALNWLGVSKAADVPEAVSRFTVPEQNIVFADADGNIGYFAPAHIPVRGPANDTHGLLPAPGWKAGYDWTGYLPYDELPRRWNPEKGYIATANSKIVDDDYPHFISSNWAMPYRTWRIEALIEARDKHTPDSLTALQMDDRSLMAGDLLPLLLQYIGDSHPDIAAALTAWDLNMDRDRPEPLIYMAWHRRLAWAVYGDELGEDLKSFWRLRPEFLHGVFSDPNEGARWCDDVTTSDTTESCGDIARRALDAAMEELSADLGADWQAWRWGDVHLARHAHRPFSQVALLRNLFDGVIAVSGGPQTVQVTNVAAAADAPFEARHGASYRAVYDLADLDNSRYVIPLGQSGNLLSPYYANLMPLWRDGRYIRIPADMAEAAEGALGTLVLKPAS